MTIAKELMTQAPATVSPTDRLRKVVGLMRTFDVRHMPVVDEEGKLVGMISDRDVRALSMPWLVDDVVVGEIQRGLDVRVVDVMSSDVLSVNADEDAQEIVDLMIDHKIGAVPIVDDGGELVGIVSYLDLLRAMTLDSDEAA